MLKSVVSNEKLEYGDFQTPQDLTNKVCKVLSKMGIGVRSIVEPTCGEGNFLASAIKEFPNFESAIGADVNPFYIDQTRAKITDKALRRKVVVQHADFFAFNWQETIDKLNEPILVIGNPPWATNAKLGLIGGKNLPVKSNFQKHNGFLAITGKSNFDISEWMLLKMTDWLNGNEGTLAMLCKKSVARKVLTQAWKKQYEIAESRIYSLDTKRYFGVSVEGCLLVCQFKPKKHNTKCKIYGALEDTKPSSEIGFENHLLIADVNYYTKWAHLLGEGAPWRSGIKHDCSKVMELRRIAGVFVNGLDEKVDIEDTYLYPMLKSSELVNDRQPSRWMIVTQKKVGEDTSVIKHTAPKTWKYLNNHIEHFNKRGSSIYKDKPSFSIFGVGDYSFSPWKIAISGLYKQLKFSLVGKSSGKPIVLDDTQNFLSFTSYKEAQTMHEVLNSDAVREFFSAFIFWDEKRPITVQLLKYLDINRLLNGNAIGNTGFSEGLPEAA